MAVRSIPTAFIWRRVHSLMGLWLVVFLCEHLFINSQAALWLGDDGKNFVSLVNLLQAIPALQVVECILIGTPILVHTIWGVKRVWDAKINSFPSDGSQPSLPYARNQAFTWQRLSSWILVAGLIAHVVQMRFVDYPKRAFRNNQEFALVKISTDAGLDSLSQRLGVSLYSAEKIAAMKMAPEEGDFVKQLDTYRLKKNQIVAAAPDRGKAILLTVRDTFKSPLMDVLYTLFVLAAVFHGCNGFWTFLITWGMILSAVSQKLMSKLGLAAMAALSLLGLAAIWLTYWFNLRH
jgi:succinate dehydrogenase / fumarate reductase, cytochrome b subunit